MDYPLYPEGRNKYSVAAGYNFKGALNRALKNGPPTIQGTVIQRLERDPYAPFPYHIPRHVANRNLYSKMRYTPKYAAAIKERMLTKAMPKINALRQMEEYQLLEPEEKQLAEKIIKLQHVYLPTSYEANLNENIKTAVASRKALGLPPAGRTHKNANRPPLPPPKSRKALGLPPAGRTHKNANRPALPPLKSRKALGLPPAGRTHTNTNRPPLPPPKSLTPAAIPEVLIPPHTELVNAASPRRGYSQSWTPRPLGVSFSSLPAAVSAVDLNNIVRINEGAAERLNNEEHALAADYPEYAAAAAATPRLKNIATRRAAYSERRKRQGFGPFRRTIKSLTPNERKMRTNKIKARKAAAAAAGAGAAAAKAAQLVEDEQ